MQENPAPKGQVSSFPLYTQVRLMAVRGDRQATYDPQEPQADELHPESNRPLT